MITPGRRHTARITALCAVVITALTLTALPAAADTPATAEQPSAFSQTGNLLVAAICLGLITTVGAVVIWFTARARRAPSE